MTRERAESIVRSALAFTQSMCEIEGACTDEQLKAARGIRTDEILTALSAGEGTNPPPCPCCGNKETERASWACAQCGYNSLAAPAPQEEQKPCDPWPNDGTDPLYCGPGGPCPKCNPTPPAREETKFPAPFEGCDHTTPERVEAVWHAQLCPICATKNWRAAQRELEQLRSATPASAPEAKETNDGHDSDVDAGGADRSCGSRDGRGVASVDHREEDCPAPMVTDPAPVPRCDGSPGEPGWSLTPTGCVRFDNNGQMIRCSGCPSCQGRK